MTLRITAFSHSAECLDLLIVMLSVVVLSAVMPIAHYAGCHYAECRDLFSVMLDVAMLSVVMPISHYAECRDLFIVMLSVMATQKGLLNLLRIF